MKIIFIKGVSTRYKWYPELYCKHPYLGNNKYATHVYSIGIRMCGKTYGILITKIK